MEFKRKTDTEVISTIDELNQYLNGNVTKVGLEIALRELLENLEN